MVMLAERTFPSSVPFFMPYRDSKFKCEKKNTSGRKDVEKEKEK